MRLPPDQAPRVARHLVELSSLSVFSAVEPLVDVVLDRWPKLTTCEARRAVAIFLELRRADDDFERFGWRRIEGP